MADEDESAENFESPQGAEELVRNLLEQVKTIGEKVKKKKEHLEEVSEKYHNELLTTCSQNRLTEMQLSGIQLYELCDGAEMLQNFPL